MKKRLISLLVALCMAVTLLPVSAITAWAEGGGQLKIVNGYPEGSILSVPVRTMIEIVLVMAGAMTVLHKRLLSIPQLLLPMI